MMTQSRVLVADAPDGARLISNALRGAAAVMPVSTGDEAIDRACEADLLALSIHFNNSRIFDVIRMTKSDPKTRHIPLLCFRSQDREIPIRVLEALNLAQSLFGHIEFLDVVAARRSQGDEAALRILRAALLTPLLARIAAE